MDRQESVAFELGLTVCASATRIEQVVLAYFVRVMEGAPRGGVLLCAGALVLAGCGGGGGGSGSDVRFSFPSASSSLEESASPLRVTVVLSTSVPELAADVTVEVYDVGTGTATPGSDYAAFAPRTVTFAKGWGDGASVVVPLQVLEDDFVEAPVETVVLGLRAPRGGVLAGATQLRIELSDADAAWVSFATEAGAAGEGSEGSVALELDCGAGVTLQVDASVRVSDSGNGTAEPLADYEPFPAQTVTFPAGSTDGAVQTASLTPVQDASAEVLETIELALSHPSPTCVLGAVQTHVLWIEDDDLAPLATFQASEGATGTENGLAYDARIDLGTDAVGGGPNA